MMFGWTIRQSIKRRFLPVARACRQQLTAATTKAKKTGKKAGEMRKRGFIAAKNAILPMLPGVSKLIELDSPVPNLLTSNDPPDEEEIAVARNAIIEVEREEERMKTKLFIRSLSRDIGYWSTVTRHKVEQTSQFIQQHRGVVSPLRTIPPEILQEIFLWVVYLKPQPPQWASVSDVPWALAQVCRSWRQHALGLSVMWSRLPTMDLSTSDSPVQIKLQLDYLEELLHRSRSAPLEVNLYSLGFKGLSHPVIDLLIDHCERWEAVTIKIDISLLHRFREIKGRLPTLKNLSLYLSGYGSDIPTIDMFDGAPLLRQVDVGGPFLAEISLPFSQLAHYKDKMRMRNSITRVVTAANSLEALTILELCETSGTPPIPAVTLPYLRKLQVKFCCTRPDFLNNLSVPAIEEIQMVSYHDRGGLLSTLINIISNSPPPCPLKALRFRTHAVQAGQLPDLLQLTPHLNHLNMPLPHEDDIEALASQPIIPCLESCEFFINDVAYMSHDNSRALAINRLAASRCDDQELDGQHVGNSSGRLKHLELHFDRSRWIPKQKAILEGWGMSMEGGGSTTPEAEYLRILRNNLHDELPELELCPLRRLRRYDKKRAVKVKEILNSIDSYNKAEAGDIFVSEIHLSLRTLCEKGVVADKRGRLGNKARRILEKWEPVFQRSLSECRWMLKGGHTMVYVTHDDNIRSSPDALKLLVYGVEDVMSYRTAFWPIYMN